MAPDAKVSSIKAFFIANPAVEQALPGPMADFNCTVLVLPHETIPSQF